MVITITNMITNNTSALPTPLNTNAIFNYTFFITILRLLTAFRHSKHHLLFIALNGTIARASRSSQRNATSLLPFQLHKPTSLPYLSLPLSTTKNTIYCHLTSSFVFICHHLPSIPLASITLLT